MEKTEFYVEDSDDHVHHAGCPICIQSEESIMVQHSNQHRTHFSEDCSDTLRPPTDRKCEHCRNISQSQLISMNEFEKDIFIQYVMDFVQILKCLAFEYQKESDCQGERKIDTCLTIQKLADLEEELKCRVHLESLSQICCKSCGKLPVFSSCIYDKQHGGHDKEKEIRALATVERNKLMEQIVNLCQYQVEMYKVSVKVKQVKKKFRNVCKAKRKTYYLHYYSVVEKVQEETKSMRVAYKRNKHKAAKKKRKLNIKPTKGRRHYLQKVRQKYELELRDSKAEHEKALEDSCTKRNMKTKGLENVMIQIKNVEKKRLKELNSLFNQSEKTRTHCEKLTATACGLIKVRSDWLVLQSTPAINYAVKLLDVEIKNQIQKVEKVSQSLIAVNTDIRHSKESPVNIGAFSKSRYEICGIASCGDDKIFITGRTSIKYQSFIILSNMAGKVLSHELLDCSATWGFRYCAPLSKYKIATVCWYNVIGVYDVRSGPYIKTNISDVISSWPKNRCVEYVATDCKKNRIFVGGCNSRSMYAFDVQLKYLFTLSFPEAIEYPYCQTIGDQKLLVCDDACDRAYLFCLEEDELRLLGEFLKPDSDTTHWSASSVCVDSKGFIYILWNKYLSKRSKCFLVQYSHSDCRLLAKIPVNRNAQCMTKIEIKKMEKLVVCTKESGKLFVFDMNGDMNRRKSLAKGSGSSFRRKLRQRQIIEEAQLWENLETPT